MATLMGALWVLDARTLYLMIPSLRMDV